MKIIEWEQQQGGRKQNGETHVLKDGGYMNGAVKLMCVFYDIIKGIELFHYSVSLVVVCLNARGYPKRGVAEQSMKEMGEFKILILITFPLYPAIFSHCYRISQYKTITGSWACAYPNVTKLICPSAIRNQRDTIALLLRG